MLFDQIVRLELAALLQQQDGGCGELLGDRAQAELSGGSIRYLPLQVGEAVALVEQRFAAACHQHRSHECMIGKIGLNDLLHAGNRVCLGLFLRRTGSGKNKQERDAATHKFPPWMA